MIKRILVNFILIFLLLFFLEAICFNYAKKENIIFKKRSDRLESNKTQSYTTTYKILEDFNPTVFRKSFYIRTKKKPVILFGCSFAEGAGLDDNNTPCAKISKLSGRSCINKSKGATGLQFVYKQLSDENFYKEVPDAEYIVYIYIYNHISRLYNYQLSPLIDMFNLRYKVVNGKLKEIKPIFKAFYSSYAIKRFLNTKVYLEAKLEEKNFKLFNTIMKENVRLAKEHYPNVKIILLEYPELTSRSLPKREVETLEKMGITVVKITDLTTDIDIYDKKYWLNDNIHPNNDAWNYILPRFVDKYINH